MDIRIVVNQNEMIVSRDITIEQLLKNLEYSSRTGVWIGGGQLLRNDYPTRRLKDGDEVWIRSLIAGG